MASNRPADGASGREAPDSASSVAPTKIRLRVENLLGQRTVLLAPIHSTIRAVKEALAGVHGVNVDRQSLVRCGEGSAKGQYTRLEDHKTLQEYDMVDDERLLLIPAIRSGPKNEASRDMKIFIDNGDKRMDSVIDRMLKECGKTRKADCHYVLAQMDSQRPGDYTILEIPLGMGRSVSDSSEQSDQGKQLSQRALTAAERKQNLKTRNKMKKLQERIDKKKKRKQLPTSPVAKMEMPCGSCGVLTTNTECARCDQVYCPKHVKGHACSGRWCRTQ